MLYSDLNFPAMCSPDTDGENMICSHLAVMLNMSISASVQKVDFQTSKSFKAISIHGAMQEIKID